MKRYTKNEGGFTIIELMIVVAIVATLSGIAFLASKDMYANYQLRGLARQVYSDMQLARVSAIKKGEEWRVDFQTNPQGVKYILSVKGGVTVKDVYLTGKEAVFKTAGVKACNYSDDSADPDDAEFNPNGTASAGGVKLSLGHRVYRVYVSSTGTGHVRILNTSALKKSYPDKASPCP